MFEQRACRVCGCTETNACEGGCWWVEYDLCSACEQKPAAPTKPRAKRRAKPKITPNITYLKPAAELAADKPHGVRLRYMAGCRCDACRRANTAYETERAKARKNGDWNGIVPADRAREHLKRLSHQGVGRRTAQACTDVADTVLMEIINGQKRRIRARTERLILGVTKAQAADHALVSARKSSRLIAELLEEGYTQKFLAKKLGYKHPALQFGADTITVRNAARVERLHRELTE
ncbi:MAG: hypothetical protein DI597_00965 [Pseudoxanthomonas spadix]|nr:MAG: hypothetical protein DI597_00965 [Pseudoxanthomonas spadix]